MKKKKIQFSKLLLVQESALIWVVTVAVLVLAFVCVKTGNSSDLPWLTAMVGCPWAAYGVSQAFYYKKSEKENTAGGIVYDSTMAQYELDEDLRGEDSPTFTL